MSVSLISLERNRKSPRISLDKLEDARGDVEFVRGRYTVDWRGCRPGYYSLEAMARVHGEDSTWVMNDSHQVFYWRPMPKFGSVLKADQLFLLTARSAGSVRGIDAPGMEKHHGDALQVSNIGPGSFERSVRLTAGEDEYEVPFFSVDYSPPGLAAVFEDSDCKDLAARYVGKTLYPVTDYLAIIDGSQVSTRWVKRGVGGVVIKAIWRAAAVPPGPGQMVPGVFGGTHELISAWYPLYVVFEVPSAGRPAFVGDRPDQTRFIAVFPDPWAFERSLSTTTVGEDFAGWTIPPDRIHPIWPVEGMSPKQLAWLRGWPATVLPLAETLKLEEWRYPSEDHPEQVFRFRNGKLLPGTGVFRDAGGPNSRHGVTAKIDCTNCLGRWSDTFNDRVDPIAVQPRAHLCGSLENLRKHVTNATWK